MKVLLPKRFTKTNLSKSVRAALGDYFCSLLWATAGIVSLGAIPLPVALLVNAIALQRIAYHLRGLEVMVHEGSHYNWTRNKVLNDFLTDWLAASPVFSGVKEFRASHQDHHQWENFGGEHDPDAERFRALMGAELDRGSPLVYLRHMGKVLPKYMVGWWKAIGTRPAILLKGLVWHAALIAVLSLGIGAGQALACWAAYFMVPYLCVLPVMRFMAEVAKHPYADTAGKDSWVEATVSNIGLIHTWLLHPHRDGWHSAHHEHACIPHHHLKEAHSWLLENDPAYAREVVTRLRVFEEGQNRAMRAQSAPHALLH